MRSIRKRKQAQVAAGIERRRLCARIVRRIIDDKMASAIKDALSNALMIASGVHAVAAGLDADMQAAQMTGATPDYEKVRAVG